MCEATIVLPRPKRRTPVAVEKKLLEKVCLTVRKPEDDDDLPSGSRTPEKPPPETGRLQRLKELHMAFNMLDENRDGKISCDELSAMLNKLGIHIPEIALSIFMEEKARCGQGLSEYEFLKWIEEVLSKEDDANEDILAAFKIFDTDGDGFITRKELCQAMETIGEKLTDKELDDILQHTDSDRDGRINYEEFLAALT